MLSQAMLVKWTRMISFLQSNTGSFNATKSMITQVIKRSPLELPNDFIDN